MIYKNDEFVDDRDNHRQTAENSKPNAYRVEDDNNPEEKDLKRSFLFGKGDDPAHPTEGKGEGGHNFGKESLTPAGDDKNNPSRYAGYTNAYFARTEPAEEHPEDSNFTAENQNYAPKPEKTERRNGENDRPHPQEPYYEGTADNDGKGQVETKVPGPNELSEQQRVGEDDDEKEHIET